VFPKVVAPSKFDELKKKDPKLFEEKVTANTRNSANMGGTWFTFPNGVKKQIFRSSFIVGKEKCLKYLIEKNNVSTIINYYGGSMSSAAMLSKEEMDLYKTLGGSTYIRIMDFEYKFKKMPKDKIIKKIVEIIKLIEYAPENVLIHCYGGMHRTGIIYGVMQKCLNKIPVEKILDEYKCHVAWESKKLKGGYCSDNETMIREFPCKLLR